MKSQPTRMLFASAVIWFSLALPSAAETDPVLPGSRYPDVEESAAISYQSADVAIRRGTGEFHALVRGENTDSLLFRVDSTKQIDARFMRPELHARLIRLASKVQGLSTTVPAFAGKALKLEVLSAWQDRDDWSLTETGTVPPLVAEKWSSFGVPKQEGGESQESFSNRYNKWIDTLFSFHEGRGANLTVRVDNVADDSTNALSLPELFNLLKDDKDFDFVSVHGVVDASAQAKYKFVHVSVKVPEAPLLVTKPVALSEADNAALEAVANRYLTNIADYTEAEALDSVVRNRTPQPL